MRQAGWGKEDEEEDEDKEEEKGNVSLFPFQGRCQGLVVGKHSLQHHVHGEEDGRNRGSSCEAMLKIKFLNPLQIFLQAAFLKQGGKIKVLKPLYHLLSVGGVRGKLTPQEHQVP